MTQPDTGTQGDSTGDVSRRSLIRGVALGGAALPLLAACGGGGDDSADAGGSGGSSDSGGAGGSGGSSGGVTVAKSDVPVGGGKILAQEKVVVVQPSKGDFKAYTAVCTHQGCTVGTIENGEIVCPCHMSHFSIKDGSNTQGPNGTPAGSVQPLAAKKVTVKGSQLSVS